MNIESELKKEGIEVVSKLSTLEVNTVANSVANKLANAFPSFGLSTADLFMKLSRLDMYRAKMPEGMSEANYYYRNTSIYFNEHVPTDKLDDVAVHECIHYLQEVKDKKDYLIRMGLCNYTEFKIYGLGLNEAAVQLMAARATKVKPDDVKYFGISFTSDSPTYYPLECNIVKQMAYVAGGEDVLFESTLNSNDNFKNAFISATSEKTFYALQNALDTILHAEEDIIKISNKIQSFDDRNEKVDGLLKKISNLKNTITVTFMRSQNLIISSCFDNVFDNITRVEEIDEYRTNLQKFQNITGTADGYTFFNNYYIEKMAELDHKYNVIENGGIETAVEPVRTSKFFQIIRAIKAILFGNGVVERDKKIS